MRPAVPGRGYGDAEALGDGDGVAGADAVADAVADRDVADGVLVGCALLAGEAEVFGVVRAVGGVLVGLGVAGAGRGEADDGETAGVAVPAGDWGLT